MDSVEKVVLVDLEGQNRTNLNGKVITLEKEDAHRKGELHRAFSIFLFNNKGEILLQQRAIEKYHSGGLWSNACCGHPRPEESLIQAAHRRLREELNINTDLTEIFTFVYKEKVNTTMFEHEYDHVLLGICGCDPKPDRKEIQDWKWMNVSLFIEDITNNPDKYTSWLKIIYPRVLSIQLSGKLKLTLSPAK